MLAPFSQNWRISALPYSISLANRVNTGGSFTTPSGLIANEKYWAARGFQGYGPRIQYPRGAGMDGLGCGCGCGGGCGPSYGMGQLFDTSTLFSGGLDPSTWGPGEWLIVGLAGYVLYSVFSTTRRGAASLRSSYQTSKRKAARRRELEGELASL